MDIRFLLVAALLLLACASLSAAAERSSLP